MYYYSRGRRPLAYLLYNMSTNVYAKFRCAALRIKKNKTRTTRVAFWDPPSGSNLDLLYAALVYSNNIILSYL